MNNRNKRSDPESELYSAILKLQTVEECYDFFTDLCTFSELKAMEQRFELAKLLNDGLIYNDILEKTGASSATISRVNRSLNYGMRRLSHHLRPHEAGRGEEAGGDRRVSAYETLAACYDELTYDIPYEKNLTFFERLCARTHIRPQTVLDLACGTGSLSVLLAQRGYRVIGADLSEDMLAEAEQKAQALSDNRPFFICQSMQRLRLRRAGRRRDLHVSTASTTCRSLRTAARRSSGSRGADAGRDLCVRHQYPHKLRGLDGQVFLDETDDTYCVWRTEFDERKRLCYYGMDIFRLQGTSWQRSFEEHIEYAYEPEELEAWLREAGFTDIRQYGDLVLRRPKQTEQRIFFSARKENP